MLIRLNCRIEHGATYGSSSSTVLALAPAEKAAHLGFHFAFLARGVPSRAVLACARLHPSGLLTLVVFRRLFKLLFFTLTEQVAVAVGFATGVGGARARRAGGGGRGCCAAWD